MNSTSFSVIIPTYNVEKYLHQCVDSILSQTYKNIEVILVDDGSPDRCPQICDEYVQKDSHVKVIHKKNGGSSDARNVGLENATGEYVIFIDSDDYWNDNDALNKITYQINKYDNDVVIFGCYDFDENNNTMKISRNGYDTKYINSHNKIDSINKLFYNKHFPGAAWLIATKKELIFKNNIFFKKGITAEDYDWLIKIFYNAKTIGAINEPFYIYRYNRSGSITDKPRISGIYGINYAIKNWLNINDCIYICFTNYLSYIYLTALKTYYNLSNAEKISIKKDVIKYSIILKESNLFKNNIIYYIIKILGINNFSGLINKIYNITKS